MIPVPSNVRIWLAAGHPDMRKGMTGLTLLAQEHLKRDPHVGDVYAFRGRRGDLLKIVWHDGVGLSLYAERLDRGRFVWPASVDGTSRDADHNQQPKPFVWAVDPDKIIASSLVDIDAYAFAGDLNGRRSRCFSAPRRDAQTEFFG